ncbi:diguanylate cyclase (GGDEF)-like protein [Motilibacter rhizosphaerae]|uniref:Diguanylate cyclase (GGDEF)-like protein n=1 Tax=Motilibacter rhizosphaerae TaxID=598652 RepID=A0A4Q7NWV1_9ACTN|nr:GGDEF domain-containing protein [Motilibacter rhizosphaerae]RZS91715.1 diguanylate cyclase (GGDEF)-like protein [Motilibacter rhizosphaerae]
MVRWAAPGALALLLVALQPQGLVGGTAYVACFLALVLAAWRAALRPSARTRLPWVCLAAAQTAWFAGDVVYDLIELGGSSPSLSPADALWLAGYPLLLVTAVVIVRYRAPAQARAGILDGLILTTAAAMVLWLVVVAPVITGIDLADVLTVLYPLGDVALLAGTLFLTLTPGRRGTPTLLLLGGTGLTLASDTAVSVLADAPESVLSRFDCLFLLANAAVVGAARHPSRDTDLLGPVVARDERLHPARVVFLGAALLAGPTVLAARGSLALEQRVVLAVGSTVTVALALARFTSAVHEQARAHAQLAHLAAHDGLTGLANRRALTDALEERLATGALVLYLDLDGFKAVNDRYGHAAGDAVLVEVAERLRSLVRPDDVVARLGGDEFVVVCPGSADGEELAERVRSALGEPVAYLSHALVVGASTGVAVTRPGDDVDGLLRRADAEMYAAKRAPVPAPPSLAC